MSELALMSAIRRWCAARDALTPASLSANAFLSRLNFLGSLEARRPVHERLLDPSAAALLYPGG
jgi:hypothetical protein